jgi:hypothetical protein
MRTITVKFYQYDELPTEEAKQRAREWFADGQFDYDWWDFTYEDAERIGLRITSFDCERHNIEGELLDSVNDVCKKIIAEHGKSTPTYKLAKAVDLRKSNDNEGMVYDFRHALLEEYLSILIKDVEYMQSTEAIEYNIRANEYEFTENGKRAGL